MPTGSSGTRLLGERRRERGSDFSGLPRSFSCLFSSPTFLGISMGQSQNPPNRKYYGVHFFYNPNLPYKSALVSHTVFHERT